MIFAFVNMRGKIGSLGKIIKNTGKVDTPILEEIRTADFSVMRPEDSEFFPHYSCGATSTPTDYAPLETVLKKGSERAFAPLEEKIGQDCWWIDAGWYPCRGSWPNTGTWEVDKTQFPNGLRGVTDVAHRQGMKTLLWFEPERVG